MRSGDESGPERSVSREAGMRRSQPRESGFGLAASRSRSAIGWRWAWRVDSGEGTEAQAGKVRTARRRRLEAILFLAREPLNSRRLAQLAELQDGTEARSLIRRLNDHYRRVQRSFRIEQVAGGYRMMTRPQFAGWLRRTNDDSGTPRLSAPALETLAVVAYRQPVLRAELEAIRGVSCGELLRQLMDRNLVRISGRSEELGRPFLYSTTRTFLTAFGLNSLDDLPPASVDRRSPVGVDPQPGVSASADAHAVAIPSQEDADVTVTAKRSTIANEELELKTLALVPAIVAADEDDDFAFDDDEEDDDDEEEEEEDFEDEEYEDDEEFDDEDEDDDDDSDDEDEEWVEVEDEEGEESEDEESDDDEELEDEDEEEWDEEESEEEEWDDEDEDEDEEEEEEEWE